MTGARYFSAVQNIPMNSVPHADFYSKCNGAPFPTNNGAGFEAELSLRSSVNFNNEWKYTSTPHTHVHGVILDRQRGILSYLLLQSIWIRTVKGELINDRINNPRL